MNIDERLDRLVEQHKALALALELLAAENKQIAEENKQRDKRLGEIMEGIARLVHIAEMHGAASPG